MHHLIAQMTVYACRFCGWQGSRITEPTKCPRCGNPNLGRA